MSHYTPVVSLCTSNLEGVRVGQLSPISLVNLIAESDRRVYNGIWMAGEFHAVSCLKIRVVVTSNGLAGLLLQNSIPPPTSKFRSQRGCTFLSIKTIARR